MEKSTFTNSFTFFIVWMMREGTLLYHNWTQSTEASIWIDGAEKAAGKAGLLHRQSAQWGSPQA